MGSLHHKGTTSDVSFKIESNIKIIFGNGKDGVDWQNMAENAVSAEIKQVEESLEKALGAAALPAPSAGTIAQGLWVAVRPLYLAGGLMLFVLGALTSNGAYRPLSMVLGVVVVVLVHTITHWINDAEDVATDNVSAATAFTGGSRAIQRGLITPSHLFRASAILSLLVFIAAGVAAITGDMMSALLWIALLIGGYAYSGRPFELGRRCLGEIDTAIVMGVLAPLAGAHAAGGIGSQSIAICTVLATETILARLCTAYPDLDADRSTGKKTIPAVVGRKGTVVVYVVVAIAIAIVGIQMAPDLPFPSIQRIRALGIALLALIGAGAIAKGYADQHRSMMPLLGIGSYGITQTVLLTTLILTRLFRTFRKRINQQPCNQAKVPIM